MNKKIINPWKWQDQRNYVQAIEISGTQKILHISGQTAIDQDGNLSQDPLDRQIQQSIQNLTEVLVTSNYPLSSLIKLTIYSTDLNELYPHFDLIQQWIKENEIVTTLTVLEVKNLFGNLKIEIDAIAAF